MRKAELAKLPASQRLVFAPPHPKTTLTVFTDVNCGFCRQLHDHIDEYNKAGHCGGIRGLAARRPEHHRRPRHAVIYQDGVGLVRADRKNAFTAAKERACAEAATCANPVKDQFELGERLGVNGTPAVVDRRRRHGGRLRHRRPRCWKAVQAPAAGGYRSRGG